ncbi:hypothetical protein RclHR1_00480005 [Rhizophagus clarus]|uniref:Uncharacterized protein n=1 Tax=Rhizophagus clarus TaxID=94130 RepID=A0A2Z6RIT2_9GLOM|nr:hypothetical protein RclHR1_00480005 [Rhizophagus clarus]
MRVDLAEHTLSKDVENAIKAIDKLREISAGTRKPLEGLTDSRLQTLKNVCDWISQDMLEGLFGTIRHLGGDSSTQTLKGYGHALNKFQVTAKMTTEVKSLNYGKSNRNGMKLDYLTRYDYRTKKSKDNLPPILLNHITQLSNISPFT